MMWGPYMYQSGAGMGWWMLVPTLFGVALLGVIIWAVARLTRPRPMTGAPRLDTDMKPEEILRRRYAAGEIDAQTFEAMSERLISDRSREMTAPKV